MTPLVVLGILAGGFALLFALRAVRTTLALRRWGGGREEVREGALHFDYRLHEGPSTTRNALAILELAGYPAAVVADARRTADRRDAESTASPSAPHATS